MVWHFEKTNATCPYKKVSIGDDKHSHLDYYSDSKSANYFILIKSRIIGLMTGRSRVQILLLFCNNLPSLFALWHWTEKKMYCSFPARGDNSREEAKVWEPNFHQFSKTKGVWERKPKRWNWERERETEKLFWKLKKNLGGNNLSKVSSPSLTFLIFFWNCLNSFFSWNASSLFFFL